ncbi:MAG: sel1 repeat family protein [Prevotella sp.]|nr:sel1 repeat family protein [Prevotella sp.]
MEKTLSIVVLLLSAILTWGQSNDKIYSANITGASVLVLDYMVKPGENDTHPFDRENNLGVFYPDDDGVIRIELPNGYYQYLAKRKGRQPENGSFYISNRSVSFELRMLPPFCGIDTRKMVNDAYYLLHNKKKKEARELLYTASEGGNVEAMYGYARMCYNGIGGSKNKNHAYHHMKRALERGHPHAGELLENFKDKSLWK